MRKLVKRLSLLLVLVIVAGASLITLSACGNDERHAEGQSQYIVYGNGSTVVRQGDFIYFVNGYVEPDVLSDRNANQWGTPVKGAIYRVNANDISNFNMENPSVRPIVQHIVTLNRGFTIMGDWIYYSTTSTVRDKNGSIKTSDIVFMRVKTDGSARETIITLENFAGNSNYGFYRIPVGNHFIDYFAYMEGDKIYQISMGAKIAKKAEVLAENVTGAVFATNSVFDPAAINKIKIGENDDKSNIYGDYKHINGNFIYFTQNPTDEETRFNSQYQGNWLKRVLVGPKSSNDIARTDTIFAPFDTCSFVTFKEDILLVQRTNSTLHMNELLKIDAGLSTRVVANLRFDFIDVLPVRQDTTGVVRSNKIVVGIGSVIQLIDFDEKIPSSQPYTRQTVRENISTNFNRMGIGYDAVQRDYYLYFVDSGVNSGSNVRRVQLIANAPLVEHVSVYNIKASTDNNVTGSAAHGFGFLNITVNGIVKSFIFGFENGNTKQYKYILELNTTAKDTGRLIGVEHNKDIICDSDDDDCGKDHDH